MDDNAIYSSRIREESFTVWPHSNIPTGPLVIAGFSCIDPETSTVGCTACGLEMSASNLNGTSPYYYHVLQSPECSFFYPDMSHRMEQDRRQSFLYWTGHQEGPDVEDLVTAGFYVAEFGEDNFRCFCCDLRLPLQNLTTSVRQEHARLSPSCIFIRNLMIQELYHN
ncbi:baculoviral IAP repeat-containing protein 2-like [Argopecten irradians]|uniref:baculoviral IAP repeat-containing protein 2-like n=1 Tax=Argopecten irradians TaxID=31199 RepID=UPI003710883D